MKAVFAHSIHCRRNMTSLFIQILIWLMQPHVWRFVGLASAAIGLLCYALSSAFNHLFGEWNLLKIFLYSILSFIICLAVLFAKVWQHSSSLRFKAHMAFLVLTITSFYSFFFDKAVNGKPDSYSLVSCAVFAVMSLSLSRQTQCGFEVDLLYFFLGALIVQLMKIKLWLGIAGVGYSYFLIILRSSLAAPSENISLGPHVVIHVDSQQSNPSSALFSTPQQAHQPNNYNVIAPRFIHAMEELRSANRTVVEVLWGCLNEYLTDKDDDGIPMALVNDHNFLMDVLRSQAVDDLHENVKLMIASGFEKECLDQYNSWRREFLVMCLSRLGLTDWWLRLEERKTDKVYEKTRIRTWIKASNVAVRILFPNERRLCDRIFLGFSFVADLSFMQTCSELTSDILNFANSLVIRSRSPNHLTSILRVYETMRKLIPEFQPLFSDQCSVSLKIEAFRTSRRLWQAINDIFMKLKNMIHLDTAQETIPGGGVCAITIKVMNCLSLHGEVVFSWHSIDSLHGEVVFSWHSIEVTRIIELLESHLEAKSKHYTDPAALGFVFLMNNGWYIVQKAKQDQLRTILGDDWIQRRTAKVRQNLEHYQRSSWDEVLQFLKLDSNDSVDVDPNVEAESMKVKLNLFNMHFKERWRNRCTTWFVDEELREEMGKSLKKILFPAYGMFIERFQKVLDKHADKYIRYSMVDMEDIIKDFWRER